MKQTPDLVKVQGRMQPGVLTLNGFLGNDPRPLGDILAADAQIVAGRGLTTGQIADRLAELTSKGVDLMEREVLVEGRFRIVVRDDRGVLPSPWGDGHFGKGDTEVTDTVTGRQFRWNELTIHLIRTHGFFNGTGSPYRFSPEDAVDIFGLSPLEDR